MKYTLLTQDALAQKTDCLVIGLPGRKTVPEAYKALDDALEGTLTQLLKSGDINTKQGEISWVPTPGQPSKRLLVVGLGDPKELTEQKLRKAIKAVMSALAKSSSSSAILSQWPLQTSAAAKKAQDVSAFMCREAVLALEDARYRFNDCKSKKKDPSPIKQLKLAVEKTAKSSLGQVLKQTEALACGISLTKELGNLPGNICTPDYLGKQAKSLAKDYSSIKTTVLNEKDLKSLGMGSFLSVAAGSAEPPRLICMEYYGGKKGAKPHVLVGKGITFDSGGISLKPGAGMDEMKFDMCGAASVFGVIKAIADMNAKVNVIGVVAAAENMPGSKATKPGDIVTSMSGQTIEILNTDAEGRLVLCDALTYVEKFEPASVVDIATLTGACVVALGNEVAGLMSTDDGLADELLEAGQRTGDRAWRLPLYDEYQPLLDSNFADMQNIGGRWAGTITAGCFLSRFTKKYPWAHLDIAGVAWHSGRNKGASGRPVSLLIDYLLAK